MLPMNQLIVFLFIGIFCACPGYGQNNVEFPNNYDLPQMLTEIKSIISASQDLQNISYDQEGFSILDQYQDLISNEGINQFLKDLLSDPGSGRCFQDLQFAFENPLANNQLGLKMLDAFGKPESGILEGNAKWFGNYHECINIRAPPNQNSAAGDFKGQYCTLDLNFEVFNKKVPLSLGVCVPDSCGSVPLEKFNVSQLSSFVNITKKTCQPTSKKVTSAAVAMICVLSFFVLLALVGSSITVYEYIMKLSTQNTLVQFNLQTNEGDMENQNQNSASGSACIQKQKDNGWYGTAKEFFNCFCVFTNGEKILSIGNTEGQLLCLHGIRFISMTWVIVCHIYGFLLLNTRNISETIVIVDTWLFEIVLNGYYSVDSFFFLSGFLVAYLYFQESAKNKKMSWIYFYVHRYVRLTPVYMMVLGFWTALNYYVGSGPYWTTSVIEPVCQDNWWYNILYINNFAIPPKNCMPWTWYLANDMQFFVVCPIILITLWRWPKIGYSVLGLFMSITVAANIGLTYHYKLQSGLGKPVGGIAELQMAIQDSMDQQNLFYKIIYEKPYARMSPYLVGIALAYYLVKRKLSNNTEKLNLITLVCGWVFATAISLACLFGLHHRKLSLFESALYNAFSHASFTSGLGWVIFTCLNRQADIVDKILSFKLFIPLSRLTYCAYLIHPLIVGGYFQALKTTFEFSHMTMVTLFLGLLVITYAASFVVSVLFESPLIRLEKFVRTKLMS